MRTTPEPDRESPRGQGLSRPVRWKEVGRTKGKEGANQAEQRIVDQEMIVLCKKLKDLRRIETAVRGRLNMTCVAVWQHASEARRRETASKAGSSEARQ
jgi:hypothetical protein